MSPPPICLVIQISIPLWMPIAIAMCQPKAAWALQRTIGHGLRVQRDQNLWSCNDQKGYSPEDQFLWAYIPKNSNSLSHFPMSHEYPTHLRQKCPSHLSQKCSIPISHHILTSHFIYVWRFSHHVKHHVPAVFVLPHSLHNVCTMLFISFLSVENLHTDFLPFTSYVPGKFSSTCSNVTQSLNWFCWSIRNYAVPYKDDLIQQRFLLLIFL